MTPGSATSRPSAGPVGPLGTEAARPQCTARSKRSGERCKAYPIHGGTVCIAHGGGAPQTRAAAARRLELEKVEAQVRNAVAFEALEGVRDPVEVLAQLTAETLAFKKALAARVNALAEDDQLRYRAAGAGTEQIRGELLLYERAVDRATRLLSLLQAAGFEERRVRLDEQQAGLVVSALRAIFARLQLTAEQQALVPVVVPQELRRVAATVRGEVVG